MQLTHYGHACLLVESAGSRLLIDPGAFSPDWENLTGLDAVVVTHEHFDHVDTDRLPGLLERNPGVRLVVEPGVAGQLQGTVSGDVEPLASGATTTVGQVTLTAVGGQHAVIHPAFPGLGNIGVLVSADGEPTLFHPGDELDATPEGVDVLALPVSAPWCALKESVDFLHAVGPRVALPVHDAILSPGGRSFFVDAVIRNLLPEGTELRDVPHQEAVTLA